MYQVKIAYLGSRNVTYKYVLKALKITYAYLIYCFTLLSLIFQNYHFLLTPISPNFTIFILPPFSIYPIYRIFTFCLVITAYCFFNLKYSSFQNLLILLRTLEIKSINLYLIGINNYLSNKSK